jgi:uncharacterized protein (DUF362 family)
MIPRNDKRGLVAIVRGPGRDKRVLLQEVADKARFWPHIEAAWKKSGKPRAEFRIAIKVNLMLLLNPRVPEVATDPELVEHLVYLLNQRGFSRVTVVESQNTGNNWLKNRTVKNVARVAGYSFQGYDFVDLTLEKERHTFRLPGYPDWNNWIGPTWRDADYRIDFAKFKTQLDNYYTLCTKNEFGTLPLQNKYWHYHAIMPYWACTVYTLASFCPDFGFVDGYVGSDGAIGFAIQYSPKELGLMLAGDNIFAIDSVGSQMMGLDPLDASIMRFAVKVFGEPQYDVEGDATPLENWDNVPEFIQNIGDIGQSIYALANAGAFSAASQLDMKEFPPRIFLARYYFKLASWILLLFFGKKVGAAERKIFAREVEREVRWRKRHGQAPAGHHHEYSTARGGKQA